MATKSYTDLEQSRKLAGILPIESADMCYIKNKFKNEFSANLSSVVEMQAYYDSSIYEWDRFYELTHQHVARYQSDPPNGNEVAEGERY